jgi:hypothetical protein
LHPGEASGRGVAAGRVFPGATYEDVDARQKKTSKKKPEVGVKRGGGGLPHPQGGETGE